MMTLAPCLFPLSTHEMLAEVTTPILILQGTRDTVCNYEGNAVRTYTHLGTDDSYLVTLVGATHTVYPTFQDVPLHFAVAFFGDYLKGDPSYAPYLTPDHLPTSRGVTLAWGPYEGE